jgi:hypothetical protein
MTCDSSDLRTITRTGLKSNNPNVTAVKRRVLNPVRRVTQLWPPTAFDQQARGVRQRIAQQASVRRSSHQSCAV